MKKKESILIILVAGIGDLVLSSKSLKAIRNGFPEGIIHLLVSTEGFELAENYKFVDKVWTFPIRELRKRKTDLWDIFKIAIRLRKEKFSMAVNLYKIGSVWGALKMGVFMLMVKPRVKIGHSDKGFGLFLNKKAPAETFSNRHFCDAMMDIALLAGGRDSHSDLEIYWNKVAEEKWANLFSDSDGSQRFIVGINPGGDRKNRRWAPEKFAAVADALIDRFSTRIFIFGGPGEETTAKKIQMLMRGVSVDLAGKLSLNDLAFVLSKLNLFVTNDSGPMHIAAAVETPLVAIFGPENPVLFGPYASPRAYRVVHKMDIDCRPCRKKACSLPSCLDSISVHDVLEECVELLTECMNGVNGVNGVKSTIDPC